MKKKDIYVTAVCPGPVETEFFGIALDGGKLAPIKKLTMAEPKKVVKKGTHGQHERQTDLSVRTVDEGVLRSLPNRSPRDLDGVYQLVTAGPHTACGLVYASHAAIEKGLRHLSSSGKEEKDLKLRLEKGTYGYRTAYKKRQLFFVVLFILAIVAQLILRNFVTAQIYKNLITISAILTVLPMANLASPLVVASRIPEVPEESPRRVCLPYEDKFPILYDLVITSNDLIMPVDAAVVHPTGVYLYCTNQKRGPEEGGEIFKRDVSRLEAGRKREGHERGEKVPTEAF